MQEPKALFVRLRYANPDDALRKIAQLVRQGCSDPDFLWLLADQIDPDVDRTHTGSKFVLRRTTGKQGTKVEPNYKLRWFLETHVDIFKDYKAEAVKAEAARRFDVSVSTCKDALKVMREWQKKDPCAFAMREQEAHRLREDGDPDHQPIWSDVS